MNLYKVKIKLHGHITVPVEADSVAEAKEKVAKFISKNTLGILATHPQAKVEAACSISRVDEIPPGDILYLD